MSNISVISGPMFTTAETLILVKFRLIVKRLIFGLLLSSYNLGLAKLIINRASGNPGTVHGIVICQESQFRLLSQGSRPWDH